MTTTRYSNLISKCTCYTCPNWLVSACRFSVGKVDKEGKVMLVRTCFRSSLATGKAGFSVVFLILE